jgi:hypothetical protein
MANFMEQGSHDKTRRAKLCAIMRAAKPDVDLQTRIVLAAFDVVELVAPMVILLVVPFDQLESEPAVTGHEWGYFGLEPV